MSRDSSSNSNARAHDAVRASSADTIGNSQTLRRGPFMGDLLSLKKGGCKNDSIFTMVGENLATRHTQAFNLLRSMRILLLEDNDINRQLLSEYLNYLGYQVLALPDGCHLFQALSDFQPQLILLDLKLPGIDGYTILEQIQQSSDWHQVPVIVVSAFAFKADQQRAMNLGAKRYFVKPVKLPHLKQAIQEELDGGSG